MPEENQTIISLSRYQRTSVSSTVTKTVTGHENIEIKQCVEAKQRQQAVGRDGAARGQREQAQHEIGEQNSEQDEEEADGRDRHFSHQTAPEDHDAGRILTFWAVLPIMRSIPRYDKETQQLEARDGDGIYHKKRQS